jgi:hypothetical protein
MSTKVCTGPCGRELPEEMFHWRSKAKGLRIARCRDCAGLWSKAHYKANRKQYLQKAIRWSVKTVAENQRLLVVYLLAHPCVDCGEKDPLVLTFDHVRGVKRNSISAMVAGKNNWVAIEAEIAKCIVRCANCHMRRTAHQLGFGKIAALALVGRHLHGKQV